jgi:hypothetical protein
MDLVIFRDAYTLSLRITMQMQLGMTVLASLVGALYLGPATIPPLQR